MMPTTTPLGSRRELVADLESAARAGERVAVALFHLDDLRRYRYELGQAAGDALLLELAGRLTATMAGIGDSYHMGGDELCVVARVPESGARAIAALAAAALSSSDSGAVFSCSCGLAMMPAGLDGVDRVLERVEQRLYENWLAA